MLLFCLLRGSQALEWLIFVVFYCNFYLTLLLWGWARGAPSCLVPLHPTLKCAFHRKIKTKKNTIDCCGSTLRFRNWGRVKFPCSDSKIKGYSAFISETTINLKPFLLQAGATGGHWGALAESEDSWFTAEMAGRHFHCSKLFSFIESSLSSLLSL